MSNEPRRPDPNPASDAPRQRPVDPPPDPGDEAIIDHVAEETVTQDESPDARVQSPVTETGLPVEEQIRKEWDPSQGGLPTFFKADITAGTKAG
ncbi:MAG: hypothetical protein JO305_08845 [Alphaproteobacteria bacterium]|nr:hypothetical protein [Alphaproteobacteria bacterium]